MKRSKEQVKEEILATILACLLIFGIAFALSGCSTTSIYGCDHLLGIERQNCLEAVEIRDAQNRRYDMVNPR